ncbi:ATP-dependent DNA helicase RecG [Caldinitratiruptor microaerophilus]|uniref:ATP-dependent DNA helicase RecG n=1 Tax=Caldinitratiruptor microaerophilus TaxID=671077 RepID=A0AA35CJX3_9FIRM|nr:ATP-dependent DNA helicase RecG [Caldinitratiruptor microaerophilus]BDG60645.1 ATP-dependent DNA helicase RecG [Caldinitratiruptor microaerophilus]
MESVLDRDVQYVKGVGPARARLLARLGLTTLRRLVEHVPRRYLDYANFQKIGSLLPGRPATVLGRVVSVSDVRPPRRPSLAVVTAVVSDGTGHLRALWFGQGWLVRALTPGATVALSGRPEWDRGGLVLKNPEWDVLDEEADLLHAGRIVPVYGLTEGLHQREMRRLMREAVSLAAPHMPEVLPEEVRARQGLLPAPEAWQEVHWPSSQDRLDKARRTVKFQELFLLEVGLGLVRARIRSPRQGVRHKPDGELTRALRERLPFALTRAQERVIREISADMESDRPMNRLLQGDVGAGKTVVAALAMVKAVESGHQAALMAPTEILAEQHYLSLRRLLAPLGIQVALVSGRQGRRERADTLRAVGLGYARVVVGTHALLEEGVRFADLSLVVIDEQHRFGVRQRARLHEKGREAGRDPDVLVMTATPIPRTLAMTLYGDLDVSVIDEKPPGRQDVVTVWRRRSERDHVYRTLVEKFALRGQQGYVIAPLVEESDRLEAQAATTLHAELVERYGGTGVRFGLLHGRMRPEEKEATMEAFRTGAVQVLVATTVVEVGVDVPNASVIVIEEADRFGLAQLHQLRGRVGRAGQKAYCVLLADPRTPEAEERLRILERTHSGFVLAEEDLRIRGPGEFTGTQQSGWGLQFADLLADRELLEAARAEAERLLARSDAALAGPILRAVEERWGETLGLARVG